MSKGTGLVQPTPATYSTHLPLSTTLTPQQVGSLTLLSMAWGFAICGINRAGNAP